MDSHIRLRKSIASLTFFSRCYGVLPVTISKKGKLTTSLPTLIFGLSMSIVFGSISSYERLVYDNEQNFFLYLSHIVYPVAMHLVSICYNFRYKLILQVFQEIFNLTETFSFENLFRNITVAGLAYQIGNITAYILFCFANPHFFPYAMYYLTHVTEGFIVNNIFIVNLQYASFLYIVSEIFDQLNQELEMLSDRDYLKRNVIDLIDKYNRSCRFCDLLSRCFDSAALSTSLYTLCITLFICFDVVYMKKEERLFMGVSFLWLFLFMFQQWMVLHFCERVLRQVITITLSLFYVLYLEIGKSYLGD